MTEQEKEQAVRIDKAVLAGAGWAERVWRRARRQDRKFLYEQLRELESLEGSELKIGLQKLLREVQREIAENEVGCER